MYLSIFLWKSRRPQEAGKLRTEARLLPKKVIIFLASFFVATIAWFLLSGVMLALTMATEGWIENWVTFFIYPLFAFLAIYIGVVVYRRLGRFAFNK